MLLLSSSRIINPVYQLTTSRTLLLKGLLCSFLRFKLDWTVDYYHTIQFYWRWLIHHFTFKDSILKTHSWGSCSCKMSDASKIYTVESRLMIIVFVSYRSSNNLVQIFRLCAKLILVSVELCRFWYFHEIFIKSWSWYSWISCTSESK